MSELVAMVYGRPVKVCVRCNDSKPHKAKGLCVRCYDLVRHESHREAERVEAKQRRAADPEHARSIRKRSYVKHRDERLAHNQEWRLGHIAHIQAYKHAYNKAHPDKVAAWGRTNRLRHHDKVRVYKNQRRYREGTVPATLTLGQWRAILSAYKYRCAYCGVYSPRLTQDHVVPVSKGGGYVAANIVPTCKSCNCSKQAKLLRDTPPLRLML